MPRSVRGYPTEKVTDPKILYYTERVLVKDRYGAKFAASAALDNSHFL